MFIPLYLELWHCIYHILLTVGASWGQGREKTVVTPGKMEDMQRGGPGRIWKEKKRETENRDRKQKIENSHPLEGKE